MEKKDLHDFFFRLESCWEAKLVESQTFEDFTQTSETNPHFLNASLYETSLRCFSTILEHNVRVRSGEGIIAKAQNVSLARVEY